MVKWLHNIRAFGLGFYEGLQGSYAGVTFDDDAESPRSRAYDRGRDLGMRLGGHDL